MLASEGLVSHAETDGNPFLRDSNSLLQEHYYRVITLCTKVADWKLETIRAKEKAKVGAAAQAGEAVEDVERLTQVKVWARLLQAEQRGLGALSGAVCRFGCGAEPVGLSSGSIFSVLNSFLTQIGVKSSVLLQTDTSGLKGEIWRGLLGVPTGNPNPLR